MPFIRREHLKTLERVRRDVARASAAQVLNTREHAILERMVVGPLVNEIVGSSVRDVLAKRLCRLLAKPRNAIQRASLGRNRRIVFTIKSPKTKAVNNAGRPAAVATSEGRAVSR